MQARAQTVAVFFGGHRPTRGQKRAVKDMGQIAAQGQAEPFGPRALDPAIALAGGDIAQQKPTLAKAADGLPYTALVFGNGGGPRKATRDDLSAVDTEADDYLQEVGVNLGSPGSETHGGGDVMLLSGGAGSSGFKGTMVNTKVFGLVKSALGL